MIHIQVADLDAATNIEEECKWDVAVYISDVKIPGKKVEKA